MSTGIGSMRSHVLALYRALLREARLMPTANRRQFIEKKARAEFKAGAQEHDPDAVATLMAVGEVQLEAARVQRSHLNTLAAQGNLKGPRH